MILALIKRTITKATLIDNTYVCAKSSNNTKSSPFTPKCFGCNLMLPFKTSNDWHSNHHFHFLFTLPFIYVLNFKCTYTIQPECVPDLWLWLLQNFTDRRMKMAFAVIALLCCVYTCNESFHSF